jgi:hypothetical protein
VHDLRATGARGLKDLQIARSERSRKPRTSRRDPSRRRVEAVSLPKLDPRDAVQVGVELGELERPLVDVGGGRSTSTSASAAPAARTSTGRPRTKSLASAENASSRSRRRWMIVSAGRAESVCVPNVDSMRSAVKSAAARDARSSANVFSSAKRSSEATCDGSCIDPFPFDEGTIIAHRSIVEAR